ncbi:MAG: hypothetical protein HOP02_06385 [Methylococcaceae bacterium]|nr:hypothetical protein [Methylococcaceae bacterium]
MFQLTSKKPSFRQGSRNPEPGTVQSRYIALDLSAMPSHTCTSMWLDTGIPASMTVLAEAPG